MAPTRYLERRQARSTKPKPCKCSTDPRVRTQAATMDPLIADAFHNLTCSALCRLPEELLLEIVKALDPLSIQCLRRACRLFMRIYSSPEFTRPFWSPKQLAPVLDRDLEGYCADCRAARKRPSWGKDVSRLLTEYMHCSGCAADHPVGLFSAAQRRASAKVRICIAWEGSVRICNHRVIRWADIASIASGVSKFETGSENITPSILLFKCDHKSHIPEHHGPCAPETFGDDIYPRVMIIRDKQGRTYVEIHWIGHLRIPDLGHDEKTTPDVMRQHLKRFRPGTAEYIAPEFPSGRLPEMNCFDPNRCCCLHYAGLEELPGSWQLVPVKDINYLTCRKHPARRLKLLKNGGSTSGNTQGGQQNDKTGGHYTNIQTTGTHDHGTTNLFVIINPCPGDRCLRVEYNRKVTVVPQGHIPGRPTTAWFQALDPDSYNLTDDKESSGILWCQTVGLFPPVKRREETKRTGAQ
ncbi:hypothetical protein F5X99DRAFT_411368 [Biscogniauxia marginata]|nr:hypothetical protein F5X99DRAFT_411368 [Biscogniauxia marginata]